MAYSDVISSGLGGLEYIVAIEGIEYVVGTYDLEPGDSWFTGKGYTYVQGLRASTIKRVCGGRPGEVWPDLAGMDIEIDDPDETLAAYLKHHDGCGTAELTETLAAGDDHMHVNGTSALPVASPGDPKVVHVHREAIKYTGQTTTTLTGCTRGWHGSIDADHYYSADVFPPCRPVVADGPGSLRGRRVVIYVAQHTDAGLSATTQLWVGIIDGDHTFDGKVLRIPVAHGLAVFAAGTVGGALPEARLRGCYVPNIEGLRWGRMVVSDPNNGDQTVDLVGDGVEAVMYDSGQELVDAFVTKFNSDVTDWSAGQLPDGRVYLVCNGTPPAGSYIPPSIQAEPYGMLQSILGFVADEDASGVTSMSRDFDDRFIAERAPAQMFAVLHGGTTGFQTRLYLGDGEASMGWVASGVSIDTGSDLGSIVGTIDEVNTTDDYIVVRPSGPFWPRELLVFGDEARGPSIRQTWLLDNFLVDDVVRGLWDGSLYSGSSWGYTLPQRWLPEPALRDGDVDWAELRVLVTTAPRAAARILATITEPRPVSEIITGPLFACGIYAYVRDDGVVSWRRIELPSALEADVTLNATYLDVDELDSIRDEAGRERVVNAVRFKVTSPLALEPERTVLVIDNESIQRHGTRPVRLVNELGEVTEDITLEVAAALSNDIYTHGRELAQHMTGPLRLLGVPRASVELPVTIKARTLEIGDAVLVTTPRVRDPLTGTMGVTARLAMVVGWERQEGYDARAKDRVDLWMLTSWPMAISPAALATDWDAAEEFAFNDTTLFKRADDVSDLSYFEAGDVVEFVQHDDDTPTLGYGTIATVDVVAKTVGLTGTPTGTITTPCIMRFRSWSSCSADQKAEGWVFCCDDADGLIAGSGTGGRWG